MIRPNRWWKRSNLQIEVIEHPEADAKAEPLESDGGSAFVESNPNAYSESYEPNHRRGTEKDYEQHDGELDEEGEAEYSDSLEDAPKRSLQSFGKNSGRRDERRSVDEENKIKQNAKNARNGGTGISDGMLSDFVK